MLACGIGIVFAKWATLRSRSMMRLQEGEDKGRLVKEMPCLGRLFKRGERYCESISVSALDCPRCCEYTFT